MTETHERAVPRKVMLATDLTPACDRAFDRAVQLARQWGAHLAVVHVVETGEREVIGVEHRTHLASRELELLLEALQERGDVQFSRQLGFGSATERLVGYARELECDFIVTGLAYAKTYGEKLMGSTVEHLVRKARAPVMSVRRRMARPYRSVTIGVDFSEPFRRALDRALALFPGCKLTASHAHDIGFAGMTSTGSAIADYEATSKAGIRSSDHGRKACLPGANLGIASGRPDAFCSRLYGCGHEVVRRAGCDGSRPHRHTWPHRASPRSDRQRRRAPAQFAAVRRARHPSGGVSWLLESLVTSRRRYE